MKSKLTNYIYRAAVSLPMLAAPFLASAREDLGTNFLIHKGFENHTEWNAEGHSHSYDEGDGNHPFQYNPYLEVGLKYPLSNIGNDDDIIVFMERCSCDERQPIAFKVMGSKDGNNYEYFCNVYFLYRGRQTREFSMRIHRPEGGFPAYTKLRFYPIDNNTHSYTVVNGEKCYAMGMDFFQVIRLGRNETYEDTDNFARDHTHANKDWKRDYESFTFVPTRGIVEDINHNTGLIGEDYPSKETGLNPEAKSQNNAISKRDSFINWLNDFDWNKWKDGGWNITSDEERKVLEKNDIQMPDYTFVTASEDSDIAAGSSLEKMDGKRQRTHVTEHILYALPGEPYVLYPYYQIADPRHYERYRVDYAHWYDYRTGGRLTVKDNAGQDFELLDFLADPYAICKTDYGFFGGYKLTEKNGDMPGVRSQNYGMTATFYAPRNVFDGGVMGNLPFREIDKAKSSDADSWDEFVIAADFSQSFNRPRNIRDNKIHQPDIAFRHIFRIRDGKKFADNFSGSHDKNMEYIRENKKYITAIAGMDFQYRLETPVPKPTVSGSNWLRSLSSDICYRTKDGEYRRVKAMRIKVVDENGNTVSDPGFYFAEEYVGMNRRTINGEGELHGYSIDGNNDEYYDYWNSTNYLDDSFYKIDGKGGKFYRMLKLPADRANGKYRVQIIALEMEGNKQYVNFNRNDWGVVNNALHNCLEPVKIDGQDLVVAEYEIEFVSDTNKAFLSKKEDLKNNHGSFTQKALEERYGKPKGVVNFDEYTSLESLSNWKDYLYESSHEDNKGFKQLRWPVTRENSTYAFGYNENYDYNMYRIANHSSMMPWANRATGVDVRWNYFLLDDRLYERTNDKNDPEYVYEYDEDGNQIDAAQKRGYMYYVNAASDPGVMARLDAGLLCKGSTIHVSAWLAELSKDTERANVAFNIMAVLKGSGERVKVHTFVTGTLPEYPDRNKDNGLKGQWYNVYYSFNPDIEISSDRIERYELELDGNCNNSNGADFVIDDIKIFVVSPVVTATQMNPVCDNSQTVARVRLEIPFAETLMSMGEELTNEGDGKVSKDFTLYYSYVDKEKYDTYLREHESEDEVAKKAFDAAVLRYDYNYRTTVTTPKTEPYGTRSGDEELTADPLSGETALTYGTLTFNSEYDSNVDYNSLGLIGNHGKAGVVKEDKTYTGQRVITFDTWPADAAGFKAGKEYYVIFDIIESDRTEGYTPDFDIKDGCAKLGIFEVSSWNEVMVNGQEYDTNRNLKVCENQDTRIELRLWKKDGTTGEYKPVMESAGYVDWFDGSMEEYESAKYNEVKLSDALLHFREVYPSATSVSDNTVAENGLIDEMIECVRYYSTLVEGGFLKLRLLQNAYVFNKPQRADKTPYSIVAIPIQVPESEEEGGVYCTSPLEISVIVDGKAPQLKHGFKEIEYAADAEVALRIGLKQLKDIQVAKDASVPAGKSISIPVRSVKTSGSSNTSDSKRLVMKKDGMENDRLYLFSTDDPSAKTKDYFKSASGETYESEKEVGVITEFNAVEGGNDNTFSISFFNDFEFHEGYTYTMRFYYDEEKKSVGEDDEEDFVTDCPGSNTFTIKVVPEYMVWNGTSGNVNWNNDGNWKRVSSTDLLLPDSRKGEMKEYVTDGNVADVTPATTGFVPMDFTKVIIPTDAAAPYLYSGTDKQTVSGYDWYKTITAPDVAGMPTAGIQYDMSAVSNADRVGVRPWYMNTADELHFKKGTEIMNQQLLTYNRVWLDLELKSSRWYTLALPLRGIYAGDMYLPRRDARQTTELFADMTFNMKDYSRFSPAVFQRGWDKSSADVYKVDNTTENVAVKANWSHVYNDVAEKYGEGVGFSIKTDLSRMEGSESPENVLFRLPKSDSGYQYFTIEEDHEDFVATDGRTTQSVDRTNAGKLNPANGTIKATTSGNGKYFLVGNPFMAHIDMKKFLEANSDKIQRKYWYVTEGKQKVGVFADGGNVIGDAAEYLAPMQGFFVESINAVSELELTYNESMMSLGVRDEATGKWEAPVLQSTRGDVGNPELTITASVNSEEMSTAVVSLSTTAEKGYLSEEDVLAIDNSDIGVEATVFTISGGHAVSVNRLDDAEWTEIGVLARSETETELRFEGVGEFADLVLYDATLNEYTELYEGMVCKLNGKVSGRYFLTRQTAGIESLQGLSITVMGNEVVVRSRSESEVLSMEILDMQGRRVSVDATTGCNELRKELGRGVYVVTATDGISKVSKKIRI